MKKWFPFLKSKEVETSTFEDYLDHDEYLLSAIAPDHIQEFDDYVQLGSNYTRTLIVMDFQTVLSREAIQQLSEINHNVSIVTYFTRTSNAEIRAKMAKAIKQSNTRQNDQNLDEATKVEAEIQADDARMVLIELAAGNEQMYFGNLLIHITARSKDELERLTQNVKSIVGSIGTAYNPNLKAMDSYESFLPLGKNKVLDLTSRLMNSEAVSYFFPFHENEMFDEEGFFVGINEKTKNAILVDQNKLLNKHKFYIGMSGLGKSTAVFNDIVKEWQNGVKVIVLDPKGEFGPVFTNMGGQHVCFDLTGRTRINPFDLPKKRINAENVSSDDVDISENPIYNKIPVLLTRFQLMFPKLDETQYNILSNLIEKTYAANNINGKTDFEKLTNKDYPTFTDFNNQIVNLKNEEPDTYDYIKEFHLALGVYVDGIYHKTFNGHTNVNIDDNDLVSFDMLPFQQNKLIQRILYYDIMWFMSNLAINGDGSPLRFVFDEAHTIADPNNTSAMEQLFFMMKVLRSFNVGISPATQSITDFLSAKTNERNYGEAVITQSVQRMYLPLQETEINFLEKELAHKFSVKERSILTVRDGDKTKQAGKGILFVGAKKVQCTVRLNPMESALWFDKKTLDEIQV